MSQTLGICGGPPAVQQGALAFHSIPAVPEVTKRRMQEFLDRPDFGVALSDRPSARLSAAWADHIGAKYCLPVNSGTAALHMCVAALGIGPGDEVILPALTFWASAAAVLHHNAIPVFVDIEPETYSIDPARLEEKITDCTKAIMPVHLHGMPCDMDPIMQIADKHGLKVISDACQSAGSKYKGRHVGTIEDVAAFSMEVSKPLSSGSEGGLFVTNNEDYFKRAELLRQFGEIVVPGEVREYNAFGLGWNYRMCEFAALFGLGTLENLDEVARNRRRCCEMFTEGLANIKGVRGPTSPADRESVYFNYVVEFQPEELGLDTDMDEFRETMEDALRAEGVPLGKWQHRPVPGQQVFEAKNAYGKGCPWQCSHYRGTVDYRADDYPMTQHFLSSHTYVGPYGGKLVPDSPELVAKCLEGFRKVFENVDQAMDAHQKGKT